MGLHRGLHKGVNRKCYWRSHIYLVSSCYVYGSVYCALYVRMCEWFFECTMRALVGFRGCWLACKMSPLEQGDWPISTAEMSLSVHWELSQSVTDTRGTVHVI